MAAELDPIPAGHVVDHQDGGAQGHHGCEQHQDGQHHRAVDNQQNDKDRQQGNQQQHPVDAAKGADQIGRESCRARDVNAHPGRSRGRQDIPQFVHDRLDFTCV